MKFPVFKETNHKFPYIVASGILFAFAVIFCVILAVADVYRSAGLVAVFVVAGLAVLDLVGSIFFIFLAFPCVIIDETGIALYLGKLRLNKIVFTNVKRVELVNVRADNTLIINIMTTNIPSYSFRKGLVVSNVNKRRITFEHESKALELIVQYYEGEIINSPSQL